MSQAAINKFASGIADANGNITLPFLENPGQGIQWQVNVNVINSPSAAIWSLTCGFQQLGNWTGSAPFGPVKAINQDTITINGTGLPPGLVVNAQIVGWADIDDGSIIIPNNVPTTAIAVETIVPILQAVSAIATGAAGFAQATWQLRPPQNTRRLTICFNVVTTASAGQFFLIGNQSKISWALNTAGFLWQTTQGVKNAGPFFVAIEPLIDQTYTLYCLDLNPGDGVIAWVMGSQTNPDITNNTTIPTTANPTGATPSQIFSTNAIVANSTVTLINPGTVQYVNTVFIELLGVSLAAITVHGQPNQCLLRRSTAGSSELFMSGWGTAQGIDVNVSGWSSGFVVAGITY